MARSTVICALVFVACLGLVFTAPLEDLTASNDKKNVADRFVEFLKQDSELSEVLSKNPLIGGAGFIRNRRANSVETVETIDTTTIENGNQPGFFDRATSFVMELLQRFLRWINTDD